MNIQKIAVYIFFTEKEFIVESGKSYGFDFLLY